MLQTYNTLPGQNGRRLQPLVFDAAALNAVLMLGNPNVPAWL